MHTGSRVLNMLQGGLSGLDPTVHRLERGRGGRVEVLRPDVAEPDGGKDFETHPIGARAATRCADVFPPGLGVVHRDMPVAI